jgi:hypothetical protein
MNVEQKKWASSMKAFSCIWDSDSGGYEEIYRCVVRWKSSTFRRNTSPPPSGPKSKPRKKVAWSRQQAELCLLYSTLEKLAICSFEMSVNFHRTTRRYTSEDLRKPRSTWFRETVLRFWFEPRTYRAKKLPLWHRPCHSSGGQSPASHSGGPHSSPGQVRSCGICGGQRGTGAGFLRVLRFPLSMHIPSTAPQ